MMTVSETGRNRSLKSLRDERRRFEIGEQGI